MKTTISRTALAAAVRGSVATAVAAAIKDVKNKAGTGTSRNELAAPVFIRERPEFQTPALRERTFEVKEHQKGIAAARMIRALAAAKGDPNRAISFLKTVYDDALGDEIQKALQAQDHAAGGALIIPEYASEIIELLRSRTVVRRAGPRIAPMNSGTLTFRKQTAGSTATYVGEGDDIPISQPSTGDLVLVARKLAALIPISNDLLAYTSGPSADQFVRDDVVMEMSVREDRAFLRDDGTANTPRGLRYWAHPDNLLTSGGTTATDIEADFKDLLNALESADVRMINPAWFMHPTRKNHLRNLRDGNGNLIYPEMRGPNPTMYGWPVFVSTSIPANLGGGGNGSEIMLADMADVIIGESTNIAIDVSSEGAYIDSGTLRSAFSRDETLIRAIARHDLAVRHRESVAVMSDITWGA